jgi:hypothetical protein
MLPSVFRSLHQTDNRWRMPPSSRFDLTVQEASSTPDKSRNRTNGISDKGIYPALRVRTRRATDCGFGYNFAQFS